MERKMNKIFRRHPSNLVPPLEVCKKLPWLEFQNICFLWCNAVDDGWFVEPVADHRPSNKGALLKPVKWLYPAPTTEELLEKLPGVVLAKYPEATIASITRKLITSKSELVENFKTIEATAKTGQEALAQLYLKLRRAEKFHEKRIKEHVKK